MTKGAAYCPNIYTLLLGLFSPTHMVFDHERRNKLVDIIPDSPSLTDMTHKAIEMLSKNTEQGFFLMVEG